VDGRFVADAEDEFEREEEEGIGRAVLVRERALSSVPPFLKSSFRAGEEGRNPLRRTRAARVYRVYKRPLAGARWAIKEVASSVGNSTV
jgi:hypothetical protein